MSDFESLEKLGDGATDIKKLPFVIITSIFLAFAVLSAIWRILLKLRFTYAFRLEDYLIFFSMACLIAGTAAMYTTLPDLYVAIAISTNSPAASKLPYNQLIDIATDITLRLDAFQCLLWTAIFAARFSFLAFFKRFVDRMERPRVRLYFIAACMITGVCWTYLLVVPFIACPHFGEKAMQCSSPDKEKLFRALSDVAAAVDCMTILLLLSVPICILHRVRLNFYQKIAISAFTSFFIATIAIAILRAAKLTSSQSKSRDLPMQTFLVYIEGCIAIAMVSVLAFRSLYNLHRDQEVREHGLKWSPGTLTRKCKRRGESEEQLYNSAGLPGLTTSVRRGSVPKCELARKASVLRTREVHVEVHYERDMEKDSWITSPSWMKETRTSESSDSGSGGGDL